MNNNNYVTKNFSSSHHPKQNNNPIYWKLKIPDENNGSTLVIFLAEWVYGILPYCGPGSREIVWELERNFQDQVIQYFLSNGVAVLYLEQEHPESNPPADTDLQMASDPYELSLVIRQLASENGSGLSKIVLFGHGFGSRLIGPLITHGIKPGGCIIAGGVYSDIDAILMQKYLSLSNHTSQWQFFQALNDSDTPLIIQNFAAILHASRKGKGRLKIKSNGHNLDVYLPRELFSADSSSFVFSSISHNTLIIHGSGDLDIPVSNAFYLEQKLKQQSSSISRIILLDLDHWFRTMPDDAGDRISERISGRCIDNPIDQRFLKNCLIFVDSP